MLKELVKIANRLDSLGLTKEADVIDRYITKSAKAFGFMTQLGPGMTYDDIEKVRAAVNANPDAKIFFNNLDDSYAYNLPSSGIGGINRDRAKHIYAGIRFINSYPGGNAAADLTWWFQDEYVQIPTGKYLKHYLDEWLPSAVKNLLAAIERKRDWRQDPEFYEMARFLSGGGEAERAVRKLGGKASGAGLGITTSAPSAKPSSVTAPVGQTATTVPPASTTKPATPAKPKEESKPAATKPAEDPWVAYSRKVDDKQMTIKNKWIERARATGKSSSYSNYQTWLNSRVKSSGFLSIADVIMRLDAEIKGAQIKQQIAERGPMTYTEATPGQRSSTSPGRGDELTGKREFDRLRDES